MLAMEKESESNPNTVDSSLAQRHEAMIERLNNLHQSRLDQRKSSDCSNSSSSSPSFESTKSFLDQFNTSKQSITTELDHCRSISDPTSKPHLKSDLDKISISISDLEKFVAQNSYFLPTYDVRSSLKIISDLKDKLEIVNSELLPKKKFSFKNKSKPTQHPIDKDIKAKSFVPEPTCTFTVPNSPGFRDKEGLFLENHFGCSEVGEFTLSNLNTCEIRLTGRLRAIFVHKLKNCRVFVGPIMGSVHIEEVEDCLFMLASHQIRIHHAKKSDFYLRVRSRPIIEDSSEVRFAPYQLAYDGIEKDLKECNLDDDTGNWGNVDDFRWLRAVQSPNWSILPEEERVGIVSISISDAPSKSSS